MTLHTLRFPTPPGYGDVVATYSDESAGAIQSLVWMGREFIDRKDHGRLLQAAVSFDGLGESNNPTEAGCATDGSMASPSSSRLLLPACGASSLFAAVQMANWNPVAGCKHSNVLLQKRFTLGYQGIWNAIEHVATFILPDDEQHTQAQFEFCTGYMPLDFASFWTLDRATRVLTPLAPSAPSPEQPLPLVFSTADGSFAMGCWAPGGPPGGGYGRWNEGDCVKWNAVSRVANPPPGGIYSFRALIAFGSRADVAQTLSGLSG